MLDTTLLSSLWQHSVTFVHHKLCLGSIFGAMVGTWLLFMMIALLLLLVLVLDYLVFQWPGRTVSNQTLRPVRASAFTPDKIPTEPIDTIVIGSGSGGCSCANLLAQSGQTVLLLEQHQDRTGGCTHTFRLENCEWDTGMHYVSKSLGDKTQRPGALLNFMTKNLQGFTHLTDPYDQVLFPTEARDAESAQGKCFVPNGNDKYDFVTGAEPTVDSILKQLCPNGNDFLKRQMLEWMELCRIINDGFTALGLSRILPKWLQFLVRKRVERLYQYASYTVRDVQYAMFNKGYSKEDLLEKGCPKAPPGPEPDETLRRLKAVLTHPIGDYAVQPREATFAAHGITMAHYMEGAAYTVGATQNISIRSSSVVRQMGGEAFVDATVRRIIVEKGRVAGVCVSKTSELAKNPDAPVYTIRSKNVVCATSIYNLYNKLLPQDLPVVQEFKTPQKRTVRQSNGHVFLFCKIQGTPEEIGLPEHNLWYFNSYDMDEAFDEYFADPVNHRPPTVYIGFPCTKDPSWKKRFPRVSNAVLISDGLYEWFQKWEGKPVHNRGADYEEFKAKLEKHLLDILYESVPQVKGKVSFHMVGTPLSEVTYLSSFRGGSYGTMCTPQMFAPENRNWTTTPYTPVPGLFLAGSDAFLPAVCGAMYGGCFGAAAVLGQFGTIRMIVAFLGHFAATLKEENPKLSWPRAYQLAFQKFVSDT